MSKDAAFMRFISAVEGESLLMGFGRDEKGYFPATASEWFSAMNPL